MYKLLLLQFLRTKTCQFGLLLVLVLGSISILIGKQFLAYQEKMANQVVEVQDSHFERNIELHGNDLSLLLYYLKFSLVHETNPIAGFSIGQRDLNPSVQQVTILALEGQKYDTDVLNPIKLLYGNLDFSFVIIYVFPLLIIAFTYNLFSEEEESGTWKMVNVMAKSKTTFLLAKLSVRWILLAFVMLILFTMGILILKIPFNTVSLLFLTTGQLYLIFWFALCFFIICLRLHSNFNALLLLSIWLMLVVLLPAFINNYITIQYPVPEAFSTIIKQRDGYHTKWDTGKRGTLEKFYAQYPQFEHFGFPPEEGFNWSWYYAMQHLGDVESREASEAMESKLRLREEMSKKWATVIPSMHTQLTFNDIAKTGLVDHMNFLDYTNEFHEKIRLHFYPKIFGNASVKDIDWNSFTPPYFTTKKTINWLSYLSPLIISTLLFALLSSVLIRKRV